MAKLIPKPPTGAGSTSVTFTTSQSWVAPVGVTNLVTVTGRGQDGTPLIPGGTGSPVNRSAVVDTVVMSGTNQSEDGWYYWQYIQGDAPNATSVINAGGTGIVANNTLTVRYDSNVRASSYTVTQGTIAFTNAIPGSASYVYGSGWNVSGRIQSAGTASVLWQEYGSTGADTPATTGANTTGFTKTWNGGVGVPAVGSSYNNVTVVPGDSYPVVIAPGGFITITY